MRIFRLASFLLAFSFLGSAGAVWAQPTPVPFNFEFVVKFVCGQSPAAGSEPELDPVARGNYVTAINIYNSGGKLVKFAIRGSVALPADLTPNAPTAFFKAELGPGEAFEIDCPTIRVAAATIVPAFGILATTPLLKGFVDILTPAKLDVIAVYTASRTLRNDADTDRVGGSNDIQVLPIVGRARIGTVQAVPPPP